MLKIIFETLAMTVLFGLMPLALGLFILIFGNLKARRVPFSPLFLIKANISGLVVAVFGLYSLVAFPLLGYRKLTAEPKPPRAASVAHLPAAGQQRPEPKAPTPRRPSPEGFADVKARMKSRSQDDFASARDALRQELRTRPAHDRPVAPMQGANAARDGTVAPIAAPAQERKAPPIPTVHDPQSEVYLRDLAVAASDVLTRDQHQLLRDFTVSGAMFKHGLYVHPPEVRQPATVEYALGGAYTRLRGAVGQSDGFPDRSQTPLTFRIVADGRELWRSRAIQQHGEWESFDVDLTGAARLELIADCPGPHTHAWGVWLDPVLTKQ